MREEPYTDDMAELMDDMGMNEDEFSTWLEERMEEQAIQCESARENEYEY